MVKGIIENTHIISSKITKFIWLLQFLQNRYVFWNGGSIYSFNKWYMWSIL